jgi:hypothetical protein
METESSRGLFEVLIEEYNAQQPDEKQYKQAEKGIEAFRKLGRQDEEQRRKINSDEVKKFYLWLHGQKVRSALCFSGGGIRSATFGLGVLQGLARQGLIGEFDYISTVSGGGYLGSWLSAWIHRKGLNKVQNRLVNEEPASPLAPEPDPIVHLRSYSNYMSPKLGLLSADTWTLVAIFIRNLILNWLVLLPPILAILMIPRISLAVITIDVRPAGPILALIASIALGILSITYMYANRPSLADANLRDAPADSDYPNENKTQGAFLRWCLLPILLMAVLTTTFYAWSRMVPDSRWPWFIAFGVALNLGGLIGSFKWRKKFKDSRIEWEVLVALLSGGLGGLLTWLVADKLFHSPLDSIQSMALYVCFGAPAFLGLFLLSATIFVGATSRFTTDADREWFARAGAWILLAGLIWVAVSAIVIFGPVLLVYSMSAIIASLSIGSISGALTLLLGHSGKTKAHSEANGSLVTDILLSVAPALFAVFILVCLSLGTSWLIVELSSKAGSLSDLTRYKGLLEVLYHSSLVVLPAVAAAFLVVGITASLFINANKFSLHAAYRDRLIRAYLGASRLDAERKPNPFTGLDESDNLQMHELRTELFHEQNVNVAKLAALLQTAPDSVAVTLKQRLSKRSQEMLASWKEGEQVPESLQYSILDDLNRIIRGTSLEERRPTHRVETIDRLHLNRQFLQQKYRDIFQPNRILKPLHIINVTLNLVGGKNLAWQNRQAESFTISPLHSGSYCVGYRDSRVYGLNKKTGQAISLGTAAAISGAAVSPNMGYYSSTFVTFLLALFNLRLGWWLGNPGPAGDGKLHFRKKPISTYDTAGPNFAARPIFAETLGLTDDKHPYVYLSDGGHFENLGIYEMVLRRCKMIVISDGSADPDFGLEGLGNAISKIRVDLGVPIDIKRIFMLPRDLQEEQKHGYGEVNKNLDNRYCAVGTIRYSRVDKTDSEQRDEHYDGHIIYIKAFLSGTEPVDVYNYAKTHPSFPHESTADQMYSESQFESYRELGLHLVRMICSGMQSSPPTNLKGFFDFVRGTISAKAKEA